MWLFCKDAFLISLRCIQLDTHFEFRLNNKIQIRLSQHYYKNMHERKQIGFVNWKSNWILYILCCLSAVLTFEVTHNPMLHRTDLFITLFSILAIRKHLVKVWMHVHETIICYLYCSTSKTIHKKAQNILKWQIHDIISVLVINEQ